MQFSDFEGLVGEWKLNDPGREYHESWRSVEDQQLEGFALELVDGDTVFYEEMRIFYRGSDGWVLAVSQSDGVGSSTVFFRLENYRNGYFQFENSVQSFPQRIVYEVLGENQLKAFIDDGPDGDRRIDFDFARQNP